MRKEGFFHRSIEGEELGCPECGFIIDHIPIDWMDARIGDSVGCPNCGLSSRIPTREEGHWPLKKHPQDSTFMVPVPEREAERLPAA